MGRFKQIRRSLYSKFSFGEVYRRIYGRKFSFTVTASEAVKRDFRTYEGQSKITES